MMILNGKKESDICTEISELIQPSRIAQKFLASICRNCTWQGQDDQDGDVSMFLEPASLGHVQRTLRPVTRNFIQESNLSVRGTVRVPRGLKAAVHEANLLSTTASLNVSKRPCLRVPKRGDGLAMLATIRLPSVKQESSTQTLNSSSSKTALMQASTGSHAKASKQVNRRAPIQHARNEPSDGTPRKKSAPSGILVDPDIHLFKSKKFGHLSKSVIHSSEAPREGDSSPKAPFKVTRKSSIGGGCGNKSIILQPECLSQVPCRFDGRCRSRETCPYRHTDVVFRTDDAIVPGSLLASFGHLSGPSLSASPLLCKYHPWCNKYPECHYAHPKPQSCRYNESCYRNDCIFSHPITSNGCPVVFNCTRPYCKEHHPRNYALFCSSSVGQSLSSVEAASSLTITSLDHTVILSEREVTNSSPLISLL